MMNSTTIQNMSDWELNNMFSIKNTQYNRNSRYSDRVKMLWKKMYDEDGYKVKTIAMIWECTPKTVRMVVDPVYRAKRNEARKAYNKKYYRTHPELKKRDRDTDLVAYKRRILSSSVLAHLQSI